MRVFAAILLVASAASAAGNAGIDVSAGYMSRPDMPSGPAIQLSGLKSLGSVFSLGGVLAYQRNQVSGNLPACMDCLHPIGADTIRVGPALRATGELKSVFGFVQFSPQYAADFVTTLALEPGGRTHLDHGLDLAFAAGFGARFGRLTAGGQVEALVGGVAGFGASFVLGWRL